MDLDPFFDLHCPSWNEIFNPVASSSHQSPHNITLPEEILECIVKELSPFPHREQDSDPFNSINSKFETHTLFNLSLASKAMNRIVEPILYKTFCTLAGPHIFLAALDAQPHRIQYVGELVMVPTSTPQSPNSIHIAANLRMRDAGPETALLLRLGAVLEASGMPISEEYPWSQIEHTFPDPASEERMSRRRGLNRVVLRSSLRSETTVPDMRFLYQFPLVEEKVFHGLDLDSMLRRIESTQNLAARYGRPYPPVRLDCVKSVHLSECCLGTGAALGKLLSAWPRLTSLVLTWDACTLNAYAVSNALVEHSSQLESLRIDTRHYATGVCRGQNNDLTPTSQAPEQEWASEGFCGSFGNLMALDKLRYLAMGPMGLLAEDPPVDGRYLPAESIVENLPASVQHLVIIGHAGLLPLNDLRIQMAEDRMVQKLLCSTRVMNVQKVEVLGIDGDGSKSQMKSSEPSM